MTPAERTAAAPSLVAAFPPDNAMFITCAGGHTSDTVYAIHRVEGSETVPVITGRHDDPALAGGQTQTLCSVRASAGNAGTDKCE